jgi:Tfp pilus assembly protein PilP
MRALLAGLLLTSSLSLAAGPRDPFAPPREGEKPVTTCTTSLCRHDLADLKLVAIVARGPESVAMFENREGKGFVARRNAQIGTTGARVTQIDRECLTLTRFTTASDGHYQPVVERVCLAGADQIADHDYLTDGPYRVP